MGYGIDYHYVIAATRGVRVMGKDEVMRFTYLHSGEARKVRRSDVERIAQELRLPQMEGVSVQQVADAVFYVPKTREEYDANEVGFPARAITLQQELPRIQATLQLRDFLNDVWVARPFHLGGREDLLAVEGIDDLESSLYLVLSGHYRPACSLLRSACESVLLSIHFKRRQKTPEWEAGDTYSPSGKRLIGDVIPRNVTLRARFEEHMQRLHQYVHFTSYLYASEHDMRAWSSTYFDAWYQLYCESVTMMAGALLNDYWAPPPLHAWVPVYKYLHLTRQSMGRLVHGSPALGERNLP
jgi:hypothetical protein